MFWKVGLRVDQGVAADHHALAHDIGGGPGAPCPALLRRQDFVAGRQAAAARVLQRDRGIDELKRQLGGAAEQRLDMLGIVHPRELDEDAVRSLALDRRLLGPGLVDAPADDLDRLIDCLPAPRLGCNRAEAHRSRAVGGDLDGEVRIDLAQGLARGFDLVGLADREDDRIAFDAEPGIPDIGVTQRVAHIVDDRVEPLALRCGDIDLEEQIGTAAQIQPERYLLVRQPIRQLREKGRAEQVRQ